MLIRVTDDHIDRGRRCSAFGCPVALALSEATGADAALGKTVALLFPKGELGARAFRRIEVPAFVLVAVAAYDRGGKFPRGLTFEIPDATEPR